MLLRNVPIYCSLMLILSPLLAPVSTQFALSEDRLRDDSICGRADSECVIISQCPSVLKLVFKVKSGDPSAKRQLIQLQCGFENSLPKVCCRLNVRSSSTTPRIFINQKQNKVDDDDNDVEIKTDPTPFTTSTTTTTTTTTTVTTTTTTTPSVAPLSNYSLINDPVCGTRTALQFRITLGTTADGGQFPWMAALMYRNRQGQELPLCGASLVSSQHLVTAAHCDNSQSGFVMRRAVLGQLDISAPVSPPGVVVDIAEIIKHPEYTQDPVAVNDIAIIKLVSPVIFTDMIRPICVFHDQDNLGRDIFEDVGELIVAGWGRTEKARSSPTLQYTHLSRVDNGQCDEDYKVTGIRIQGSQVCAQGEGGTDSCSGDSGGPLMRHVVGDRWYLAGVVSFGTNHCNSALPGVYTNIASFYDWILTTLQNM